MLEPRIACFTLSMALVACAACGAAGPSRTTLLTAPARPPGLASLAGEELDRAVSTWSATRGVIVVLDPRTGEILAMEGREDGRDAPRLASDHAWVTGSTLKPLTIAAALERRTITRDQRFPCGERAYGDELLRDAEAGPCAPLDAAGIVAHSSNVGTACVFDTLGSRALTEWLRALHIGDPPGSLPRIEGDGSFVAASFAGGEVATATPLQLARAYGALFNGGVYALPDGTGPAAVTRVVSEETSGAIVAMLEGAVAGEGTGKAARIDGARAAGKTGTADIVDAHGAKAYYVSFVGSVLDREPRFVALVGLEVPPGRHASGPAAAAPAWARLARRVVAAR